VTIVGGDVFADVVHALEPYLDEVVFVGGWVHALYVFESEGPKGRAIRTADVDVTLAPRVEAGGRPPIVDLLRAAGFEAEHFDDESGIEISKDSIAVDLLAEAPNPRNAVEIEGQDGLRVFGYPHQTLLRENNRPMIVGSEVHESLKSGKQILVPTLAAYVTGKLLSSSQRTNNSKRAKDLAYASDVMGRDALVGAMLGGLPRLLESYPEQAALAEQSLKTALADRRLMAEVARQVIEASGFGIEDDGPVQAQVKARLSRLLSEAFAEPGETE
jgi:hypothetical protein